ncbi:hypothetical protein HK103_003149 [Boothiomyces macroporosus]|uniref:Uncharacterized protein n=1 Tax=Boothiomyces macroporosus TaxID=261099 RepID=A0AAD5UIW7_9FUNG|nr:hypothetical protein HK103_003149 [Boothiomyces macroporosus]
MATSNQSNAAQDTQADKISMKKIGGVLILPGIISSIVQKWAPLWVAYLVSSLPILYILFKTYKASGRIDVVTFPALLSIIVSVIIALVTTDRKYVNLANCAVPVILGLTFFISMFAFKENLIAIGYRQLHAGSEEWNNYCDRCWAKPHFRKSTNILCLMWGFGFLIQTALIVIVDFYVDLDYFHYINMAISIGIPALLGGITFLLVKMKRKQLKENGGDFEQPPVIVAIQQ